MTLGMKTIIKMLIQLPAQQQQHNETVLVNILWKRVLLARPARWSLSPILQNKFLTENVLGVVNNYVFPF